MKIISSFLLMMISTGVFANPLFTLEKSFRQKNVLHFTANSKDCKFHDKAITNFWIMGEERGQIEQLAEGKEKKAFTPKITYLKDKELDFTFGAMTEMGSAIPDKNFRVVLDSSCKAKAFLEVDGDNIQVTKIFVKVSVMSQSVSSMTLYGVKADGTKVTKKISL